MQERAKATRLKNNVSRPNCSELARLDKGTDRASVPFFLRHSYRIAV